MPPTEPTEEEIDQVLAEFGGDPRAAIAALLHDIAVLAEEGAALAGQNAKACEAISFGYARGKYRKRS